MKQKYIKDNDGNIVLPITSVTAVRDNEGQTLAAKIEELELKSDGNNNLIKTEESRAKNAESSLHSSVVSTNNALNTERSERTAAETQLRAELNAKQYEAEAIELDTVPTKDSTKMVNSGAVYTALQDMTYDVSVKHPASGVDSGNTYTLSGALSVIPAANRKAGMNIKFIDSEKNEYVQYRFLGTTTNGFTTVANWQGVDSKLVAGSRNLVESGVVEQCNYDTTVRLANIEESMSGETVEKELIFEDETFTLSTVSQTEILIPIPTSIGNIGTTYIVTISGNVSVNTVGKLVLSIVSGSLNLTDIDKSLIGKDLSSGIRVKLVLKSSTDAACNLRLLCQAIQPIGRTIHVKLERFTTSDAANLKQYGTDKLLDLLHFEEHKLILTANTNVSIIPSTTSNDIECCVIKCKEGNEFIINGTGYAQSRLWAFADRNGNILSRSESEVTAVDTLITAPADSACLIINKAIDSSICYTKQVSRLINNITTSAISTSSEINKAYTDGKVAEAKHEVNLDSLTKYPYYIPATRAPYTWASGGNRRYIIIPVKEEEIITINTIEGVATSYLFASSVDEPVEGASISNIGDKVIISENTTVKVPEGANFICILYSNTNTVTVESIIIEDEKIIFDTIKENQQELKEYVDEGLSKITGLIDLSSITKYAFYINEATAPYTWSAGDNRRSVVIPVQPGNILLIEPIDGMAFSYMFLSSFTEPIAGDSVYNAGDKIISSEKVCVEVPSTASHVYVVYRNVSNVTVLKDVFIRNDEVLTEALKEIENNVKEYADEKDTQIINDLPNYVQQTGINVQNLNQKTYGFQDIIGVWWFYPEAVSNIAYRKKLFFGFADKEGFSGVAELTCDSKQPMLIKNRLKHEYPDSHDSVSVTILDDGRLLAVFPDGHGTGTYINIRISKNKYSVDEFEAPIRIKSDAGVSYSQVHKANGKYYVFFRSPTKYWRYIESEDLINWTSPKIFIHDSADVQRYLLLKPIANEPNKLRFATYSNPSYDDSNIRCGYIDFETNKIYDSTGTEVGVFGGDTPVETDDLTVLVTQPESPYKNRLLDLAVTPLNIYRFAYAYFDNSSSDGSDSVYYLYDNGTIKTICNGGQAMWIPKSQSGVQFLSDTKMVVGRSDVSSTGYDYIDIYDLVDGNVTFVKELYKELKTGLYKNRNGYPLADINGRYVIWFRGYYISYGSSSTYMRYDYDMDVMIYDVVNDKLFGGDY